MPRNLSEADRKKNQFDKEERVHLLGIMKQYAPLLDNSASTLARKRIWTTIEDEFKRAGFTSKTSAQLKKYWQNYKYHCKKARALGKENKKRIDLEMNESSEWNRYQVFVENRSTAKYSEIPGVCSQSSQIEPGCRSTEIYEDNGGSSRKLNTSDGFIDLSWIKTERNAEESMPNDCDERAKNLSESINPDEDSLDEKKEIFMNKDRLASSLSSSSSSSSSSSTSTTNTTDHKPRNRIVVSNAKISNNSVTVSIVYPENERACKSAVNGTPEACANSVSLPTRNSADVSRYDHEERRNREDSSDSCNLVERNRLGDLNERNVDASIEKSDSVDCAVNDLLYEWQARDFFKRNGATALMENQEIDAVARTGSLETRSDPFGSGGYVFFTNYRNQLKHKLLLQQLETEEKRLKVKIAEMAIQEVQLRIKALNEDMRRTEELHRLHLARAATESINF